MNESGALLSAEEVLSYVKQQMGTRAKTVLCRSAIQLTFLSGEDVRDLNRGAYDDGACIMSLSHDLDVWDRRIGAVEQKLKDGSIPVNWEELLEEALLPD